MITFSAVPQEFNKEVDVTDMNPSIKNKYLSIFPFVFAAAIITGCAGKSINKPGAEDHSANNKVNTVMQKTDSVLERMDARAYENFVNAVIAEQVKDYFTASRFYSAALHKYPDSYEIRYSLSNMYYRMQRFNDALETLKPISPITTEVNALRAICYRSVGDNVNARDSYLKLLKDDPSEATAYSFLASEYRRLNNLDSLVWAYEHMVSQDPYNARLLSELGQLKNQQEKFLEAKQLFEKSLDLAQGRENFYAYMGMAEAYRGLGQPDSAMHYYDQAAIIDPNNAYLTNELAVFYAEQDSISQALHYAEKLTRLEPNNLAAKRYLALLYVQADSILLAESMFRVLINSGDHDPGNYFYLGRIAIIKRDYESAREYLTLLTQLADSLVDPWLDLGFVYRQQGDTAKSLNVYNSGLKFVKNREDSVQLMFAIGSTKERQGQISEAAKTFKVILKLDPDHSPSLNYLGYMLADRGEELDYAKDLIEKALQLLPENPAYIDSYGWVMYRQGHFDSAIAYLEKASELQSDPIIYDHLGDAYKAVGKIEDARIWWQKALELEPNNDAIREKLNE